MRARARSLRKNKVIRYIHIGTSRACARAQKTEGGGGEDERGEQERYNVSKRHLPLFRGSLVIFLRIAQERERSQEKQLDSGPADLISRSRPANHLYR